jgi:CIC family chloride channel protein
MMLFDVKGIEEIPVVESPDDKWVLGMLKRRDVIAAYNHEVIKKGISEKTSSISLK